jgi:hypothetical protein
MECPLTGAWHVVVCGGWRGVGRWTACVAGEAGDPVLAALFRHHTVRPGKKVTTLPLAGAADGQADEFYVIDAGEADFFLIRWVPVAINSVLL